jgi:hypothetical protein
MSGFCSSFWRGLCNCGGGLLGKGVALILPLFLWSASSRPLWWRADQQERWSGLASIPLVGVSLPTVVASR